MRQIDGKYNAVIIDGQVEIVNSATGAVVPRDEPLILFRGKDILVRGTVEFYQHECYTRRCRPEHTQGIGKEIEKLNIFAREHPERMKVPD